MGVGGIFCCCKRAGEEGRVGESKEVGVCVCGEIGGDIYAKVKGAAVD